MTWGSKEAAHHTFPLFTYNVVSTLPSSGIFPYKFQSLIGQVTPAILTMASPFLALLQYLRDAILELAIQTTANVPKTVKRAEEYAQRNDNFAHWVDEEERMCSTPRVHHNQLCQRY
jgi:hypothetical protein